MKVSWDDYSQCMEQEKSSKTPTKQEVIFGSLRFARQVATRSTTATATAATATKASAAAAAAATWQQSSLWRKYVISDKDHGGTQQTCIVAFRN